MCVSSVGPNLEITAENSLFKNVGSVRFELTIDGSLRQALNFSGSRVVVSAPAGHHQISRPDSSSYANTAGARRPSGLGHDPVRY